MDKNYSSVMDEQHNYGCECEDRSCDKQCKCKDNGKICTVRCGCYHADYSHCALTRLSENTLERNLKDDLVNLAQCLDIEVTGTKRQIIERFNGGLFFMEDTGELCKRKPFIANKLTPHEIVKQFNNQELNIIFQNTPFDPIVICKSGGETLETRYRSVYLDKYPSQSTPTLPTRPNKTKTEITKITRIGGLDDLGYDLIENLFGNKLDKIDNLSLAKILQGYFFKYNNYYILFCSDSYSKIHVLRNHSDLFYLRDLGNTVKSLSDDSTIVKGSSYTFQMELDKEIYRRARKQLIENIKKAEREKAEREKAEREKAERDRQRSSLPKPSIPDEPSSDSEVEALTRQMNRTSFFQQFHIRSTTKPSPGRSSDRTPNSIRDAVWNEWCGGDSKKGNCFCCTREIDYKIWDAGHIIPKCRGGTAQANNLRPLCSNCNGSAGMGKHHMYEYMLFYRTKGCVNIRLDHPEAVKYYNWTQLIKRIVSVLHEKLGSEQITQQYYDDFEKYILNPDYTLEERKETMRMVCRTYQIDLWNVLFD